MAANNKSMAPSTSIAASSGYEYEGTSAKLLKSDTKKTVEKVLHHARYSRFVKAFGRVEFAEIHQKAMLQCNATLEEQISEHFEKTKVIPSLNTMDELLKTRSYSTTPAWRPSGKPEADVEKYLVPMKKAHMKNLTELHSKIKTENIQKMNQIEQLEKTLGEKVEFISDVKAQLQREAVGD